MEKFLPITGDEMRARGWQYCDFVVVSGDAYVDHPSFGPAIISRLLESQGYRVGFLSQPDFTSPKSFQEFGPPRYAFLIGAGNVDSMVAHYSVAKVRRTEDEYTPGGRAGKRPDRAATVYTRLAKQAYPGVPVVLGGLEASLRRFAHYDYWSDTVMPSILEDSGADLLTFGMGEHQTTEIARRLAAGERPDSLTDIPGTCYLTDGAGLPAGYVECAGFAKVAADKAAYARACRIQMDHQDPLAGKPVVQKQRQKYLVQNPPSKPLYRPELDKVYALPFTRTWHPSYDALGGVPGLAEYLCDHHMKPEQVQDFYPTPGTVSTCMFYTGLDPATMKPVYVAKSAEEKSLQRALLQYYEPRNRAKVRRALELAGRRDLMAKLLPRSPGEEERPKARTARKGGTAQGVGKRSGRGPAAKENDRRGSGKKQWRDGAAGAPKNRRG